MKLRLLFCQLNFHDFCEIDFWNNEILLIQYIWLTYPKLRVGGMSPRFCLNFHYKAEVWVGIFVCWRWYFYAPLKVLQLSVGRSVDQVYEISRNTSEFGKFSQTTPPWHTSKWIFILKVWFEIGFIVGGDANVFK